MTTNLVKIEKNIYSFYEGKEQIIKVSSDTPMSMEELENYRKSPKMLKAEVLGEFYQPRTFHKNQIPEEYEVIYYDGSDLAKEVLEHFGHPPMDSDTGEIYVLKDKTGNFTYCNIDIFAEEFTEA